MNYTPNYHLPTWAMTDRIQMSDFNDMTARIDAALAEEHTARIQAAAAETTARKQTDDTLTAAVAARGNCQVYAAAYTGTGQYGPEHPNTLAFLRAPAVVMIHCAPGFVHFMFQGNPQAMLLTANGTFWNYLTWNGNAVSWYADSAFGQMNQKDTTYYVVAFCPMD